MSRTSVSQQVRKYEAALYDLKSMNGDKINSQQFCRKHGISNEFVIACKKIGVIENINGRAKWTPGVDVDLFLAQDIVKAIRRFRNSKKAQRINPKYTNRDAVTLEKYFSALCELKKRSGSRVDYLEFYSRHSIGKTFLTTCKEIGVIECRQKLCYYTGKFPVSKETAAIVKNEMNVKRKESKARIKAEKSAINNEPQPKATAPRQKPKPKAQPQQAPKRAEREQKSISILWGMISIKY
jgi:hypothetical protein